MAGDAGGKEVGRISIRVLPDTSDFRKVLGAELAAIEKELSATVTVGVDLDTLKARGQMATLLGELKAKTADIGVGIDADVAGFRTKVAAATKALPDATIKIDIDDKFDYRFRQRLAKLKPKVTVDVDVDRSALSKLRDSLTSATDGIWNGGGNAAGGLGGVGRGLGIVAAVAALAAPALALISGVLTAMPAIIAGVLTPIAAIALGLDGIKKAAEVLKPGFDALKATMSAKFQDVFTPIFTKLNNIFPALEEKMPGVATALGSVADSFVDVVTSTSGLDKIKGVIGNISDTITASAPGIGKLTDGLLGLANGVSAKFPAVGTWLDKVGDSFTKWVDKASTVDESGTSPLDRAMGNLGTTLKGVFDIVGDLAKQGFDFLQDPKFGDAMKDFVKSCQTLINDVLPSLKQFFIDITDGLKTLTDTINLIKGIDPETGKADKEKADPVKNDLLAPFTSDKAPWRAIWADMKTDWALDVSWMKTTWDQFVGSLGQTFSVAGGLIQTAWSAVISWFSTTGGQLVGSLTGTWNTVVAAASTAFNSIKGFFTGIPGALSAAWSSLTGIASSAWSGVTGAVSSAWESIKSAVSTGVAAVVAFVVNMGGQIVSAVTGIDLGSAGRAIMDGFLGGITAGWEKVKSIVSGMKQWIIDHKGPVSADKVALTPAGTALMQGLQDGIDGGFEGVMSRTRQLVQEITDAVNGGFEGVDTSALSDKMKKQLSEIGLESDQLKVDLNGTTDKDAKAGIKDQRTQLQTLKDQLNLQQDQLGFSTKYGDSLQQNDTTMSDSLNKIVTAGKGFAESNIKQFTQDIGISGNGAISQAADQGLQFGMSALSSMIGSAFGGAGTTINVGSVDDALTAKQTLANKKALQYTGR